MSLHSTPYRREPHPVLQERAGTAQDFIKRIEALRKQSDELVAEAQSLRDDLAHEGFGKPADDLTNAASWFDDASKASEQYLRSARALLNDEIEGIGE